jgi:hypothetical protein
VARNVEIEARMPSVDALRPRAAAIAELEVVFRIPGGASILTSVVLREFECEAALALQCAAGLADLRTRPRARPRCPTAATGDGCAAALSSAGCQVVLTFRPR